MAVTVDAIKQLRATTGAGMMDAKRALEEAGGDSNRAVEILRQCGQAKATKRAEREAKAGLVDAYVHMHRVAALVEVNCETDFVARTDDFREFARDVAMQVAASSPSYLAPEDVPAEAVEAEKAVLAAELDGKPTEIVDKITTGKLDKYYAQVCLLRQPFIKDDAKTIEQYLSELITKTGENIVIARFARMELGSQ